LDAAIVGGRGRMRVDDSTWQVEGPDLAIGTKVKVVSLAGAVLVLEVSSED
jgi:membrane protein implicated in regulation of membrane protease activity